jgi:hypothetical protein
VIQSSETPKPSNDLRGLKLAAKVLAELPPVAPATELPPHPVGRMCGKDRGCR